MKLRLYSFFSILLFFALVGRLFYWQIYRGKELAVKARGQYQGGYGIDAPRGEIFAPDGSWLVASSIAWQIAFNLPLMDESGTEASSKLAPYFVDDKKDLLNEENRIRSLLSKKDSVWVPIKSRVQDEVKEKIEDLNIKGLEFDEQEERYYPEGSSSAHLLGFVGKDTDGNDKGYFGLEGYYDSQLSGKPGFVTREKDASGIPILMGGQKEVSAIAGASLLTHIDKSMQLRAEKKLEMGILKYQAKSGSVVIMDPKTGAILSMASSPAYDPKKYYTFQTSDFSNPVISSSFEPGSIFKIIIMSAGIDAGVVTPDTICDICDGPLKLDKYYIKTWNNKYNANSSMTDVILNSDNIGMSFVAQKLGSGRMYDYLRSFGIGELTSIDLEGEFTPKLRDKGNWSVVDLATASFGQGIAITPIQMIRAAAVIANDGVLVTPQVVDKVIVDKREEKLIVSTGKRVISKKAADEVTAMMVEAAKKGEAKWTYVVGMSVAGKTGTAQIPISGHYDPEKTIASFIGFGPSSDPKFIMLVTLKEPKTSPWASETVAPVWYDIAKDIYTYMGIPLEK